MQSLLSVLKNFEAFFLLLPVPYVCWVTWGIFWQFIGIIQKRRGASELDDDDDSQKRATKNDEQYTHEHNSDGARAHDPFLRKATPRRSKSDSHKSATLRNKGLHRLGTDTGHGLDDSSDSDSSDGFRRSHSWSYAINPNESSDDDSLESREVRVVPRLIFRTTET